MQDTHHSLSAYSILGVLAFSLLVPPPALAHSGGTDANGCHAGSQPYHCHGATTTSSVRPTWRPVSADRDCADFRSWPEAQAFYQRSGPGDPHRLDADRDGVACEALR